MRRALKIFVFFCLISSLAACGGGGGGTDETGGGGTSPPTLSVAAGDGVNTLTFAPAVGTAPTSFNLYSSTSPNVTTATGTPIAGVTSPFTQSVTNGSVIFYIVTAVIGGVEVASSEVGAMPGVWTPLTPNGTLPLVRDSHTAVYNAPSKRMIIFGGKNFNTPFNDLLVLIDAAGPNETWDQPVPPPPIPSSRAGHTAVYSELANQMIVFGGALDASGNSLTNDLWRLSNADASAGAPQWSLLSISGPPKKRWGHGAIYDSQTDKMVIFGGAEATGTALLNDVWILNDATKSAPFWTELQPTGTSPSARCCFAIAYDAAAKRMIIFGGFGGPALLGDLWTLTFSQDFTSATWQNLTQSGGLTLSARCCGAAIWSVDKFLLFGGGSFQTPTDDKIHALILQSTTFASVDGPGNGPPARNFPSAVPAGGFLLFGGSPGSFSAPLNDLWRFN